MGMNITGTVRSMAPVYAELDREWRESGRNGTVLPGDTLILRL
jgi:hypothetical protein